MMVPEDLPSIVKRIGSHAKNHMMLASNFSFVFLSIEHKSHDPYNMYIFLSITLLCTYTLDKTGGPHIF